MTGVRATPKYKPAANKIQRKTKGEQFEKRWGKGEKKCEKSAKNVENQNMKTVKNVKKRALHTKI